MIFSYYCMDAWFRSLSDIKLFDSDKDNISLCYEETPEEVRTLPYEAIQKVLSAIKANQEIFSFNPDEISELIEECFKNDMICDSVWESVYFSDTIQQVRFSVDNIGLIKNTTSDKLQILLKLMHEIADILSEYGIEHKYFCF